MDFQRASVDNRYGARDIRGTTILQFEKQKIDWKRLEFEGTLNRTFHQPFSNPHYQIFDFIL